MEHRIARGLACAFAMYHEKGCAGRRRGRAVTVLVASARSVGPRPRFLSVPESTRVIGRLRTYDIAPCKCTGPAANKTRRRTRRVSDPGTTHRAQCVVATLDPTGPVPCERIHSRFLVAFLCRVSWLLVGIDFSGLVQGVIFWGIWAD